MIDVSKLYTGSPAEFDRLRYSPHLRPVVVGSATRQCNLNGRHGCSDSGCPARALADSGDCLAAEPSCTSVPAQDGRRALA